MTDIYTTEKRDSIIYADPPWKYNARNNIANRFGDGAGGHYCLMTNKEISALPIGNIAA